MSASEWQLLGWILVAGSVILFTVSQIALSRLHKKMLSEL